MHVMQRLRRIQSIGTGTVKEGDVTKKGVQFSRCHPHRNVSHGLQLVIVQLSFEWNELITAPHFLKDVKP